MVLKNVFIFLIATGLFSCGSRKQNADLIVVNARIYSVDSAFSVFEAMALNNGTITMLGTSDEIKQQFSSPETLDAKGAVVYPGFIDAHCHFVGYGLGLGRVNLVGTKSFNEVVERVQQFTSQNFTEKAKKNVKIKSFDGSWIIGRGWDQNDWTDKKYPNRKKLDSLFPDRPVFLQRIDGHAALVNSVALELAGINSNTYVKGGKVEGELIFGGEEKWMRPEILKEIKHHGYPIWVPTGILIDNAVDLVKKIIPPATLKEKERALLAAQENCFAMGLTTVDDAGLMKEDVDLIDSLQRCGKLQIRIYAMLSDSAPNYDYYLKTGPYKTEKLNIRAFKFYADGALGSRGACLKEDYSDQKNWKGFLLNEQKHFEQKAELLAKTPFQMATHCIGDSAYKIILAAYKRAGIKKANRWRIEHAQVISSGEISQSDFIIPSIQPTHATSDMYWVGERLGKNRSKYAYAYKDLLKNAGLVALGTDFPVEDISPFKTFYAAVTRQDAKGYPGGGFQMENALSREEALRGMTIWAAYSNFEEHEKGSLEKGKQADFIILDTDLMNCDIKNVLSGKVEHTYIGGKKVYQAN